MLKPIESKKVQIFKPEIVRIGDFSVGGSFPVRLQSMTNTKTLDTEATVDQAIKIYKAGGAFVRITTPGMEEAQNLINIKKSLQKKGFHFPLIADVHFNPKVAEYCARIVEKIRINPGNYTDKKTGKINYSDTEYQAEIDKINIRLTPLLKICKEYGTALRIGSNHGSLSERIVIRYGDTPLGMVESAMEFIRICDSNNFRNIVISMKASNIRIMVQATRLLVQKMMNENLCFPIHLGVTEAGNAEDGRIKSACGIGNLLADGIGDTIRVSLTESPEKEIPVAKAIVNYYAPKRRKTTELLFTQQIFDPFKFNVHQTILIKNIGGENHPIVICDLHQKKIDSLQATPDFFYIGKQKINFNTYPQKHFIVDFSAFNKLDKSENIFPVFTKKEFLNVTQFPDGLNFIKLSCKDINTEFCKKLLSSRFSVLILNGSSQKKIRASFSILIAEKCKIPVIIEKKYSTKNYKQFLVESSCDFGSIFTDGLCNGMFIKNKYVSTKQICSAAYGILQATQARISKTEYISCPTCGRTQFDIEKVLSEVKKKTSHLTGLKIAVMGCIVNGPGEMADADFGCVGAGVGKVNLYKKKVIVKKNIDTANAIEELLKLIQSS